MKNKQTTPAGRVTESIWAGKNQIIPLADVQHLEPRSSGYLMVVMKSTTFDNEAGEYNNAPCLSSDDGADFKAAWCRYRSELESPTLIDLSPPALLLAAPVSDDEADAALRVATTCGNTIGPKEMRRALEGFAAGRAAGVEPVVPALGPLAKRAIGGAIRDAYDLGYNDSAMAHRTYDGPNVAEDHSGALIHRLGQLAAPQPAAQPCGPKKPEYDPQAVLPRTGDPQAEIAALRKAVVVEPMPEQMAKSIFDGIAADPKAGQFDAFNWFTAGVASAEQWQKAYLDAAIAKEAK